MKIHFGIIGSGWRAELFIKIANDNRDLFEITSVYVRSNEKKEYISNKYNVNTTTDKDYFFTLPHDFVVDVVSKNNKLSVLKELTGKNIPVLLETPAGLTIKELQCIWHLIKSGKKIQVSEQYPYYPYYQEILKLIENGTLGNVESVVLSSIHGYHATSIVRRLLGVHNELFSIYGTKYKHPIVETDSRNGIIDDGRIVEKEQSVFMIEFKGNKQALYFFNPVQYHSRIRSKTVVVYGDRGEINNFDYTYITKENKVITGKMEITDEKNDELDKVAVKQCLVGMNNYIQSGEEFYSMQNALNDAYMSIVMDQAIKKKKRVKSKKQIWQKK
jgi:predicted dehydrogenase